jgi:carbohydrate kinase (thermoresistant glucokinase family)
MAQARNIAIIVMGVSGAGKSTVGSLLAKRLGRILIEGDSLHPPRNIEKMKHGTPLNDADRTPWLKAIAARIDAARQVNAPIVVTCSALKRAYRALLTAGHSDVDFVYLKGSKELIARRIAARSEHFMPPELLDSQFSDLEEPAPDEPSVAAPIDPPPAQIVESIVAMLSSNGSA